MKPQLESEVRDWVSRFRALSGAERGDAAAALSRLGVWTRGNVRTRGSLERPAKNRLPEPEKLDDLIAGLRDTLPSVRCRVASALGEWGGETAARALAGILASETDEEVSLYCIVALRTIGGQIAAEALCTAAGQGTEVIRDAALTAIAELITGGAVQDTEAPSLPRAVLPSGVRLRGAVRTRGSVGKEVTGKIVAGIVSTLEQLQAEDAASPYLRHKAGDVLYYLKR